jgi:NTE family protein
MINPPGTPSGGAAHRIGLVLGGGGLKGFAHLGVLQALEEKGIVPSVYAGSSIGALIAAAYACGKPLPDLIDRAENLKRGDLFRLNRIQMVLERFRARSVYDEGPLRELIRQVIPTGTTFEEVDKPLLVSTVDAERGTQVVWGLNGLRDVPISDAVYASCALPGAFPPGRVNGRTCVDGGVIDNLPASITSQFADALICVDVGNSDLSDPHPVEGLGFFSVYMRAATIMMHWLQEEPLTHWHGPPMILIRPRISHLGWFPFGKTHDLIEEGYRAATEAFEHLEAWRSAKGGIFPRRAVQVDVDQEKCTGCGLCVALAPSLMNLDRNGKAYSTMRVVHWSPADGDFVRHCPTDAIITRRIEPRINVPVMPSGTLPAAATANEGADEKTAA